MAQVPSYVPTNGLVGYWPFNGNANDESGNGNNGTVNGATLTTDRFGAANKAYSFDGVDDLINAGNPTMLINNPNSYSQSAWVFFYDVPVNFGSYPIISKRHDNSGNDWATPVFRSSQNFWFFVDDANYSGANYAMSSTITLGTWKHTIFIKENNNYKIYLNGVLDVSVTDNYMMSGSSNDLIFGAQLAWPQFYKGLIDDIGIWNRALTQQEITALYTSCLGNEIISQPTNSINTIGSNAQFSVNSVAGSSYQWQSNPSNFGWQNVPNNANYSGGTTNTLTVSNVQLFNHNQPIRAISTSGNCTDTSNTVTIQVADTCITNVTVYDTLYTTVTDTLIINTTLSLPAPNNENTIMIYPNPASDHITIDNGNYTAMAGYTIKIENNAGQQVFQNAINQAQFYVDLSTWSGNGLYFVHLIDAQGNTVTVRKIVLQ
jgi:hypothetical protein